MLVTGYVQFYMYFHAVFFTTQFMICQYENYILIYTLTNFTKKPPKIEISLHTTLLILNFKHLLCP